jgi:putative spermidine/putrescine transport system ATP-binding protein
MSSVSATPQSAANASTSSAPQIELRGLRKAFGKVVAVDSVDLEIGDGEFFAMLGPSGSGKTTVLRMIAGFERPTSGSVILGGVDETAVPAFRRDVSTVFQDYALFPHMTVGQNVAYGLKVRGVGGADRIRRVGEALEMVRLGDLGARKPGELSGGQRQRVALARALVTRPKVLLLDEPLGALDLKLREQMQLELKSIQRDVGITFLFVTHDQDEALTLCDRLAVFNAGRIEQVGPPGEVYEHPATRFVAGFVGSSNVIPAALAPEIVGKKGTFAIRPEKIRVLASGAAAANAKAAAGEYSVRGTVSEVVYAGPTTRLVIDGPENLQLSATLLNADDASALRRGDPIALTWHESALRPLEA